MARSIFARLVDSFMGYGVGRLLPRQRARGQGARVVQRPRAQAAAKNACEGEEKGGSLG
jgi:hypothetical protein